MHIVAFLCPQGRYRQIHTGSAAGQQVVLALPCSQLRGGHSPLPFTGIILCWFMSHFHPLAKSTEVPRMNPT